MHPSSYNNVNSRRYIRQTILPEWGEIKQRTLHHAKVLVIGAGGIGSPALFYLASMGVGTLGIVDDDTVELSNLHRQILHETQDIGRLKVESAYDSLRDLNPDITIIPHPIRVDATNVEALIKHYDVVLDGCDDIRTRFLIHQTCYTHHKPLISASLGQWHGQLSTFKAFLGDPHPCYQCLYPDIPPLDAMPSCRNNGVFPALAGMFGSFAAGEVVKELLTIGESLSGRLILIDAHTTSLRNIALLRDPSCPCCQKHR